MSSAAIIKAARIANKLTQEQLAEKVGVHVASVRNWEKGSIPQTAVAQRLAETLNLETIQLEPQEVDPLMEFEVAELTKALHAKTAAMYGLPVDKVSISINILA